MESSFRKSMNWLHTWAGVTIGLVLFAVFWMGTLSVFDEEIDRWMMPPTRTAASGAPLSLDVVLKRDLVRSDLGFWAMTLPTERNPTALIRVRDKAGAPDRWTVDPVSGDVQPDSRTLAGTGFLYPFHIHLHLRMMAIGDFLVGLAGMAMLVLIVSGVIIHRKIFADFFALRFRTKESRAVLDVHNVSGVLALPFHFVITLSGLIIFQAIYFPDIRETIYGGDGQAFFSEGAGTRSYARPAENRPVDMASLDAMAAIARERWNGTPVGALEIYHPGDSAAYVLLMRSLEFGVTRTRDRIYFDGATGAVLYDFQAPPAAGLQHFIGGIHYIQFRHWTLRWVYFALGLAGCVLIATGFLFWLESRRKKHDRLGLSGVRVVHGLTVGGVAGIVIATLAFFVINRLLPADAALLGQSRAALEIWIFYLTWLATFAHAWLRPNVAWLGQCWAIAVLAVAAVALNWITTGDHLARTLVQRQLWAVAGMDLLLLVSALIAVFTARKLQSSSVPETAASDDLSSVAENRHA
jgi:uncharacterized iron-regulated membrane protein